MFVITDTRKKLAVTSFLLFPVFSARNRFSTNTTTNTVRSDSFLVSLGHMFGYNFWPVSLNTDLTS